MVHLSFLEGTLYNQMKAFGHPKIGWRTPFLETFLLVSSWNKMPVIIWIEVRTGQAARQRGGVSQSKPREPW